MLAWSTPRWSLRGTTLVRWHGRRCARADGSRTRRVTLTEWLYCSSCCSLAAGRWGEVVVCSRRSNMDGTRFVRCELGGRIWRPDGRWSRSGRRKLLVAVLKTIFVRPGNWEREKWWRRRVRFSARLLMRRWRRREGNGRRFQTPLVRRLALSTAVIPKNGQKTWRRRRRKWGTRRRPPTNRITLPVLALWREWRML